MNSLIIVTEIIEKLILLVLLGLSVWSVAIMIDRRKVLKVESKQINFPELKKWLSGQQLTEAKKWCESNSGFVSGAIQEAIQARSNAESVDRAVAAYVKAEKVRLEKGLSVLATLGANAPFIGLFGTVLGIIRSFAYLGTQAGSAAVMSGVSQALYATAIGLFVAIPAVVAFNLFSQKIKVLQSTVESLRDIYISKFNPE